MTLPAALALAAGLAGVGRTLRWLTTGGMLAGAVIGTTVFTGADLRGGLLLALFFISGSTLTAFNHRSRLRTGSDAGHHARTGRQVLANGLWPAVGAAVVGLGGELGWPVLVGSLAAAQGDTWATEIGMHAPTPPRLVTTARPVPAGTSGGVTALGTVVGIAGAGAMALLARILAVKVAVCVAGFVGGVVGLVADSVLGATIQAVYRCAACGEDTETRAHRCGHQAQRVRGARWMDNDMVNLLASGAGGLVAALLWQWR